MYKILIVDAFFSPVGGAEKIAYSTYKMLENHGFDVYYWATNKKPYYEHLDYSKYFTKFVGGFVNYVKNPLRYYYNIQAMRDFYDFLTIVKPDLIHIHSLFTLSFSLIDVCKNIPTIMTIHDGSFVCPSANLMYKNKFVCNNICTKNMNILSCIKNKCSKGMLEPSIRHTLLYFIKMRNINKKIDKFITPSNALKNLVINTSLGIPRTKICTINNFLNQNELSIVPNYINNGYFLYIGRLSKEKSVITLLQAMSELPRDIKLHIVGTGPEEENLKKYAEENKLHNIEFLGFKTGADIQDEYQNCIATILPCNWFEIFGMTNIESFANGKPVIASNIGGIPEIVEHNVNGLLFEPANVEQLRECILKYWNNPELVIEHGKNGYKKVLTHYTEDIYYEKLIKIYEETINECKK